MSEEVSIAQTFKLKGRLYTLPVMHILNDDWSLFAEQLAELVQRAPRLFDNTPIVLDCSAFSNVEFDFSACCHHLRQFEMHPIAIQGGSAAVVAQALQQGIPQLHASAHQDKALFDHKQSSEPVSDAHETLAKTKVHTTPIRSGQRIVSKEGDLVITSAVSHGSELLAEGHIHVYGTLRGRALAGMTGDRHARIFCQALDAELVAVAGIYCLSDNMASMSGPCQIFLQDERICIESL